jgi:hypothetical protein
VELLESNKLIVSELTQGEKKTNKTINMRLTNPEQNKQTTIEEQEEDDEASPVRAAAAVSSKKKRVFFAETYFMYLAVAGEKSPWVPAGHTAVQPACGALQQAFEV